MKRKNHVHDHIVLNILARLPVKSIIKFRCVCKAWYSSITELHFIFTHLINNNNKKDKDVDYLVRIQHANEKAMYPCYYSTVCTVTCDRTFNRIFEYQITNDFPIEFVHIVGSCNGVLCLTDFRSSDPYGNAIYLWNPSIKKI